MAQFLHKSELRVLLVKCPASLFFIKRQHRLNVNISLIIALTLCAFTPRNRSLNTEVDSKHIRVFSVFQMLKPDLHPTWVKTARYLSERTLAS